MFKNMKMGKKLIVGFGIVLAMMCISIIIAITELGNIGAEVKKYSGSTVPNMGVVWQMRRDFPSIQRYMLMALVESDPAVIEEYLVKADEEATRVNESLETFKLTSREAQETMEQLEVNIKAGAPYRQEMRELLSDQRNDEAFKIFTEQYKPTVDKAIAMMEEIGANVQTRADEQAVESAKIQTNSYVILIIAAVVAVILTVIVVRLIVAAILTPVKEVENAAASLASGDLSAKVTYDGKDELGSLAANMGHMVEALKAIISDEAYLLGEMAQGNFAISSNAREYYVGDFAQLLESMQNINKKLSETLRNINEGSDQVSVASGQMAQSAQSLAEGATEQASTVEELLATTMEVSDQVTNNAKESANASKQASEVGKQAEASSAKMKEMTDAMEKISETSKQVVAIINTIEAIAAQTNLLSLNAAIEAARAGDAGKGFAVVADEIRELANQSSLAANNTRELIEKSINEVNNGNAIAESTSEALVTVTTGVQEIVAIVEGIKEASENQTRSMAEVKGGIEQIANVIQLNSAAAEESSATSEELSAQADNLNALVAAFKLG